MRSTTTMTFLLATLGLQALALSATGCGRHFGTADGGGGGWHSQRMAYTPAGELITYRDKRIHVYDTEARRQLRSISIPTELGTNWIPQSAGVAISADGTTLVGGTTTGVEVYGIDTGSLVRAIETDAHPDGYSNVMGVAISPDGSLVAVAMNHIVAGTDMDHLTLWRVTDGALVATLEHAADRPTTSWAAGLAFSVDGRLLFGTDTTQEGSFLYAWRTADGTLAWGRAMPGPENPNAPARVDSIAVSADGTTLATASSIIDLWRTSDGSRVEQFAAIQQPVFFETVAVTADAQKVVATHYSNVASDPLLFGPDGSVIQTFPIIASGCVGAVFSPDGTRIAGNCNGSLKIWTTATGELINQRAADE